MQGKISAADIQRIAKELGENFTEKEIQDMIDEADRDRKFTLFYSYYWICVSVLILLFSTTKLFSTSDAIYSKTVDIVKIAAWRVAGQNIKYKKLVWYRNLI